MLELGYTDPTEADDTSAVIQSQQGIDFQSFSIPVNFDDISPTGTKATLDTAEGSVRIFFSEALDQITDDITSQFTINAGSSTITPTTVTNGGAPIVGSGYFIELGLDNNAISTIQSSITDGQALTVSYSDPDPNNDNTSGALQDLFGNDAITFDNLSITTSDLPPPAPGPFIISAGLRDIGASQVIIAARFSVPGTGTPAELDPSDVNLENFTLTIGSDGGQTYKPTDASLGNFQPNELLLTFDAELPAGSPATLSYTDPSGADSSGDLQDSLGNDAQSFLNFPIDTVGPVPVWDAVLSPAGNSVRIFFDEPVFPELTGIENLFTINAGSTAIVPMSVVGNGYYEIELSVGNIAAIKDAITNGDPLSVSYADPDGDNDSGILQDFQGIDAGDFNLSITTPPPAAAPSIFNAWLADSSLSQVTIGAGFATSGLALDLIDLVPENFTLTISGDGGEISYTPVNVSTGISSNEIFLTFAVEIPGDSTATLSYIDPEGDDSSGDLQNSLGKDAASFSNFPIILTNYDENNLTLGYTPITAALDATAIGSDSTFQTYFQKFVAGSTLSGSTLSADGLSVDLNSIKFVGNVGDGVDQVALQGFDSLALSPEISLPGGGLFLTSGGGDYPAWNSQTGFSVNRAQPGNQILTDFALQAYPGAGSTNDASILSFDFTAQADIKSILLDVSFASDEYPEFVNSSYVDIAAIWFGGENQPKNYAYFDGDPTKPLSIVSNSLADPRFVSNYPSPLPIEFDGITKTLTIAIPLTDVTKNQDDSYSINIGVADSGDSILDSALWISNLRTSEYKVEGTFLEQKTKDGDTYVAPENTPVIVEVSPNSTVTGSNLPDVFILPDNANDTAEVKGKPKQFDGDAFQNVNNKTKFILEGAFNKNQFGFQVGSAIITLDQDGNPATNDSITFTLQGDFFDVTTVKPENFAIQTVGGSTTLQYIGPLSPQNGGGGGSAAEDNTTTTVQLLPNSANTAIPPDSPIGKPEAIIRGDAGNNTFNGGNGNELFFGGDGDDEINGRQGNDDLRGNAGNDVLIGGEGNDYLRGGKGNDQLFGGKDADRLLGDQGDDIIDGGLGDDFINGNAGNDQLSGGLGADRFIASKGNDTVLDFSLAEGDAVVIRPGQAFELLQVGNDLVIRREQGDLTLLGINLAAFQAANAIIQA